MPGVVEQLAEQYGMQQGPQVSAPRENPYLIQWGQHYFRSPEELVHWMRARGVHTNVARFLAHHAHVASMFQRQLPLTAGAAPSGVQGAAAGAANSGY